MDNELTLNLSSEARTTYTQLREIILQDYGPNEAESDQIYRFLKARDFDLGKAEVMLTNHIKWRKKATESLKNFKMSEIHEKNLRISPLTFTKGGEPVVYIDVGNVDFSGLIKSIKVEDLIKGAYSDGIELEKCYVTQSEKLGKAIYKGIVIANYENFRITQVISKRNLDVAMQLYKVLEANFPERLCSFIAINASSAFTASFNIMKPILVGSTQSKIKVFGTEGWKEYLFSIIKEEDLPAFLGGKKTGENGNPFCNAIIPTGPIPTHCYLRSPERRLQGNKSVQEYIVKPRGHCSLNFYVNSVESTIFWKFETEAGNISFGLLYQNKDKSTPQEVIIPNKLVDAHVEMEEGSYVCERSGTYILAFDNSHSRLRMKHLFCKAYIKSHDGSTTIITR